MRKPRVFVASSSESLDVADAINVNLDHQAEVTVWKHGFSLSQSSIESLVQLARSVDFAVFVFTPDDLATIRDKAKKVVRDNVIFEMGLFVGTIGRDRCYVVKPRDTDLHLPTDLLGLNPADYDGERSDGNLEAAVNAPCVLVGKELEAKGLLFADIEVLKERRKPAAYNYTVGKVEIDLMINVLDGSAHSPEGISTRRAFDHLSHSSGLLSLAAVKLERLGYVDRGIGEQEDYEYFTLSITADGIDYLLENEEQLPRNSTPQKPDPPLFEDDDIPF